MYIIDFFKQNFYRGFSAKRNLYDNVYLEKEIKVFIICQINSKFNMNGI